MSPELAARNAERREQGPAATDPADSVPPPAHRTRFSLPLFIGAIVLFAGWLSWLAYLSVTTHTPIVLSRPQFLISGLDVIAQIDQIGNGPQEVRVKKVLWSAAADSAKFEGATVTVTNLDRCDKHWAGPGEYLLPLTPDSEGRYHVPETPLSPGLDTHAARPRIYPATPPVLNQYETIVKP